MALLSLLAPALLSATASPFTALAPQDQGSRTYLRFNGGLVTTTSSDGPDDDIDFDNGFLLAFAIGRRMTSGENPFNFDLELEGVYTDQDADNTGTLQALRDVTVARGFLNGVLDYRVADRFSLYAGAGIGAAWMDVGTSSDALNDFEDEDGPFLAWQAKAGVMWHFSPNTALTLGYRFMNIDDVQIDDDVGGADFDLQTEQHTAEIGLRFGI